MARKFNPTTTAFSVERARAAMLAGVIIPPEMVNAAIEKVHSQLKAKTTKFFTHQGEVVQRVDVEDHTIQQSAADKILAMAGLYAREREASPPMPLVSVRIDPATGVTTLVIGADTPMDVDALSAPAGDARGILQIESGASSETSSTPHQEEPAEDEPQIIQVKDTARSILKKLMSDE